MVCAGNMIGLYERAFVTESVKHMMDGVLGECEALREICQVEDLAASVLVQGPPSDRDFSAS